ncbi:hypothetical protein MATL_G00113020 [Megalops atlanticus]|uniref:Uncharacterized protein n=1 Tax=Megalops atlanticus TaxID=7932 RepID=A0A9D3TCQ5_MEGAT|nr:hypothetical protein MATL_G00113020 [Megalops atlanticus]
MCGAGEGSTALGCAAQLSEDQEQAGPGLVIYPSVDYPSAKMSQASSADEGTTFEHLWSTLEPDSTYFELPQSGHSGDSEASAGMPANRSEVCMDVFHMRDMNDTVMYRVPRYLHRLQREAPPAAGLSGSRELPAQGGPSLHTACMRARVGDLPAPTLWGQ